LRALALHEQFGVDLIPTFDSNRFSCVPGPARFNSDIGVGGGGVKVAGVCGFNTVLFFVASVGHAGIRAVISPNLSRSADGIVIFFAQFWH
jgi:hypothetical protein